MEVRRAIVIGGMVGVIDGFLILIFPTLAVVLLIAISLAPPRPAVAAGALIGVGIGMSVPLELESMRCAADSACTGPDITGWFIASLVSLGLGLLLAGFAARRARTIA